MQFLLPNEKPLWQGKYSTKEFLFNIILGCFLLFFLPGSLALYDQQLAAMSVVLVPLGLYFILSPVYRKLSFFYLISNERILAKKGVLSQSVASAKYGQISDIRIEQSLLQRILKTGSLYINTPGRPLDELIFKSVDAPFEIQQTLNSKLKK